MIQKRTMIELINRTMSVQKRMFLEWVQISESDRELKTYRKTIEVFEKLNEVICERVDSSLFSSKYEHNRRLSVMRRLIFDYQQIRKKFLNIWLQRVLEARKKDLLINTTLFQLDNFLNIQNNKHATQSLHSFHKNLEIIKISITLFRKLDKNIQSPF